MYFFGQTTYHEKIVLTEAVNECLRDHENDFNFERIRKLEQTDGLNALLEILRGLYTIKNWRNVRSACGDIFTLACVKGR